MGFRDVINPLSGDIKLGVDSLALPLVLQITMQGFLSSFFWEMREGIEMIRELVFNIKFDSFEYMKSLGFIRIQSAIQISVF